LIIFFLSCPFLSSAGQLFCSELYLSCEFSGSSGHQQIYWQRSQEGLPSFSIPFPVSFSSVVRRVVIDDNTTLGEGCVQDYDLLHGSLSAIIQFAEQDAKVTPENERLNKMVKDLVNRLLETTRYNKQISQNWVDEEMIADLYVQIANSYTDSPGSFLSFPFPSGLLPLLTPLMCVCVCMTCRSAIGVAGESLGDSLSEWKHRRSGAMQDSHCVLYHPISGQDEAQRSSFGAARQQGLHFNLSFHHQRTSF
jgi:hypothetical protein